MQLHRRHQNRRHLQTRVLQALQQVQPAVPVSAGSSTTSTLGAPLARASLAMSTWPERRRASTLLLSRFSSSPSCKRRRYRKLQTKPFVSLMSLVVGRAPASPRDRDPVPSSPPKYSSAVWLFLRREQVWLFKVGGHMNLPGFTSFWSMHRVGSSTRVFKNKSTAGMERPTHDE